MLYTLLIHSIFLPPLTDFKNIFPQKAWKKYTMEATLIWALKNNGYQQWEKLFPFAWFCFLSQIIIRIVILWSLTNFWVQLV